MAQKYVPVFLFLFRTRHLLLKFERSSHPSSMLHLQFLSHRSPQVHFLLNLKTLHIALSYLHKLQEYHSDNEMLIFFLYFSRYVILSAFSVFQKRRTWYNSETGYDADMGIRSASAVNDESK